MRNIGYGLKIPHPTTGEWIYVGKIIENKFVRNFRFDKARLEVSDCFSFDARVIPHLQKHHIDTIVFTDDEKQELRFCTMPDFMAHHAVQDHGEGKQAYISAKYTREAPWRKYPWVPDKHFDLAGNSVPVTISSENKKPKNVGGENIVVGYKIAGQVGLWLHIENLGLPNENDCYYNSRDMATKFRNADEVKAVIQRHQINQSYLVMLKPRQRA